MAKEFSAADIFNIRVEDEYQAEPEIIEEDPLQDAQFINDRAKEPEVFEKVVPSQEVEVFVEAETSDETAVFVEPETSVEPSVAAEDIPIVDIFKNTKEAFTEKSFQPENVGDIASVNATAVPEKAPKIKRTKKEKRLIKIKDVPSEKVIPKTKKSIIFTITMVLLTVLVFSFFSVFMFKQYALVFPSHDDYGYATLSYVYWEEGMWGQNFTMDQLVHYLTQHYNRWGGRILSFGQSILLLREGLPVAQVFHAITLVLTFVLAFLFAQNGKKTKYLPLAAIFTCSMFGMIGKDVSISGFYWYCAAILYTVPVLYVFIGAWLLYVMLLDRRERTISVSKLMMLPFTTVLFFFAGWSMEQVGIFAVVVVASMLVYACFTRRNPFLLVYGVPPLISSIAGCNIMLNAVGNNSRKGMYGDYYALPFTKQILASGDTIAKTLFRSGNILTVILIALVAVSAAYFILRKRNNIFTYGLLIINGVGAAYSLAVSANNIQDVSVWLWLYLVIMAVTVSIWLFSTKRKQDFLIWALFFGSLASQGACLIAPIFPDRCLMMFVLTLVIVLSRAFNEGVSIIETFDKKRAIAGALNITCAFLIMGSLGAAQVYNGFTENDRVQQYNHKMLEITGKMYDEFDIIVDEVPLMKLKDDTYAGSTQPYGRDLIKDWMKIYYKLPDNLQYEDFVYEGYSEERLIELENLLTEAENKYNELKNNA